MKLLRVLLFISLAASSFAFGADEIASSPEQAGESTEAARAEIAGLLKLAKAAAERSNFSLAETFYERMLNVQSPDAEKRDGLRQMGAFLEQQKATAKAIVVYEQFNRLFPRDQKTYEVLLNLAALYRETGAYQMAIARYYSVLNAVLKIQKSNLPAYKAATLKAQFEIADTYFLSADYKQAAKYFEMIKLLDMSAEDKARVHFKALYCKFLLADYPDAIVSAQSFLSEFPDHAKVPECRFILATALKATHKSKEALEQVLALLRAEKANAGKDPETWAYWQKKTGNEFANQFYQQGDFISALTIYQTLARLNNEPDWQWPVVYQMALCFERLRLPPRALEAYKFIVTESKKNGGAASLAPALASLSEMAQWHIDQVDWQLATETQLQSLLGPAEVPESLKVSAIP